MTIGLRYECRSVMFWVQWRQHVRAKITRACGANIIKYTLETSVAEKV
jgi:hypothetical protein